MAKWSYKTAVAIATLTVAAITVLEFVAVVVALIVMSRFQHKRVSHTDKHAHHPEDIQRIDVPDLALNKYC